MKKYVLGFIIGILVGLPLTMSFANESFTLVRVAYPIFVNEMIFEDDELPVLNYNGSTYVPLKRLADILSVNVEWNNVEKRVEIFNDNKSEEVSSQNDNVETLTKADADEESGIDENGFGYICADGIKYLELKSINDKYYKFPGDGYRFGYYDNQVKLVVGLNDDFYVLVEGLEPYVYEGNSYIRSEEFYERCYTIIENGQ